MRAILAPFLAGLAAVVAAPTPGSATLLELRGVGEIAAVSDACVRGVVSDEQVAWSRDGRVIVTTYTLDALEILAGDAPQASLRLTRVGGEIDGMALAYDGMPRIAVGDHLVVFVRRQPDGAHLVVGLKQGVLRQRGDRWVRDLAGVTGAATAEEAWSLPALRAAVRVVREPRR
jgi:hypothetical protein